MADAIRIEGLAAYRRALREMDRELDVELVRRLKEAGEIVATDARRRAPVGKTGRLKRSIKPFARLKQAGVRVSATNPSDGYAYPKRLEYERSSRARPFLEPAWDAKRDEVTIEVDKIIDELVRTWGGL